MKKLSTALISILLVLSMLMLVACDSGDTGNAGATTTTTTSAPQNEFTGVVFNNKVATYNGKSHTINEIIGAPEGTQITFNNNTATEVGTYTATATLKKEGYKDKTLSATLTIVMPTAKEVIAARANATAQNFQGFDYTFKMAGELSAFGISASGEGIYSANYRLDKTTGDEMFKRTTSGKLLFDSTNYVYCKGSQKINIKMDTDTNTVKKLSVHTVDDDTTMFVHRPIVGLIDNLVENNIGTVEKSDIAGYVYKSTLSFTSENPLLNNICSAVGKFGTSISLGGATITNPVNGIIIYYNIEDDNKIEDFYISFNITVPVKVATASITLSYEQYEATNEIQLPSTDSLIVGSSQIASTVSNINNSLSNIKNDDAYSIDLTAKNELDPSWNKLAIVDSYKARMYKNTVGTDIYFNHSYEFKAHHEDDGAEKYKFTLGNVIGDDAGVYIVSRKGSNQVSPVTENVSADTQFDFLTSMAIIDASKVDCIKKEVDGTVTEYKVYLNKTATFAIQEKIIDIINSNNAEGVLDVENYFNTDNYIIEEAIIVVKYNGNTLESIKCETEVRYEPTDGEYTEYKVTLNNVVEIELNKKLDDALDYEAPDSTGTWAGIGAAKYYIQ